MAKGQKQYTEEFKNTIVELYNTVKSLVELSSEYALSKSTITGWIKKNNKLLEKIKIIHNKSNKVYGSIKITKEINKEDDAPVNHKRIECIMSERGILQ